MHAAAAVLPDVLFDAGALDRIVRQVHSRQGRLVGWGTGSLFDYFYGQFPLPLAYLVDNDRSRWGRTRHGIPIVPPDRLALEPDSTLVVIYSSAWPDIQARAASITPCQAVPASAVHVDAAARARLSWSEQLASRAAARRTPRPARSIVVQGPVMPRVTARVLATLSALYPSDLIVLSTWSDTDAAVLAEARRFADDVVVSDRPAHPGVQNRNCQIVSTRAGVARAREHGAEIVLKTRTDVAILGAQVFDRAWWWLARIDSSEAKAFGLRGRFVVPASYTRKYLPYHPSDLVMLGHAEDMAIYWSAPLDDRPAPDSLAWRAQPLAVCGVEGRTAESYLGTRFCRAIGRPVRGDLEDSWALYRELFAVVDNEWFDLLWFKNLSMPDATVRSGPRQLVTQAFWERLYHRDPTVSAELADVDPARVTLGALAENGVGSHFPRRPKPA